MARHATTALDKAVVEAGEKRAVETAAARERVRQGVQAVTDMTKASVSVAKAAGTVATRETRKAGAERLAQVELDNNAVLQGLRGQYDSLVAQPPSVLGLKGTVRDVIEGPAKIALEKAGERVQQAAAAGPPISTQPLQDALAQMQARFRPQSIFGATATAADSPTAAILAKMSPAQRASVAGQVGMQGADVRDLARALGVPDTHPLPGILGKLQQAPSQLTFADAHALKMALDEAVNWDRTAAKSLEKMTKGVRSVLREQLGAYEPYNTATAAYHAVIPLYRKGVGKAVIMAAKSPDGAAKIAKSLRAESPDGALALRDLLVTQSAAGGDAALGQQAWDQVRAAFVYDKLLTGGVDGLQDRLKSLLTEHPEFSKVMFSDRTALQVLSNFEQIGQAYQSALGSAAEKKLATKVAGREATVTAREAGEANVARIRQAGRESLEAAKRAGFAEREQVKAAGRASVAAAREARKVLKESSLLNRSVIQQGADVMRATFQGPTSVWGALSIMRLLNGPSSADLLQYVGHSPRLTQNVVAILNSQAPDRIVSDTMRDIVGVLSPAPVPSHTQEPPRGSVAAAPAVAR